MASLTLRNKLMIGFGLIITLVVILLMFMFYILNVNMQNTEEIIEDRYVKINSVNNIRHEITHNISRGLLYLVIKDNTEINPEIEQISRAEHSIAQEMAYLQNNLTTPEGISAFATLNYDYQLYENLAHRIIQAKIEGRNAEAQSLATGQESITLKTNLFQSIVDLRTIQEQLMNEALLRSHESFKLFKQLAVYSDILLLASLLISFWLCAA